MIASPRWHKSSENHLGRTRLSLISSVLRAQVQRYCRNQNDIRRNRIHRQITRAKGIGYISPSGEQRERNTICTEAKCCSRSMVTSVLTPQKSGRLGRARNTYTQTTAQAAQQTATQQTARDALTPGTVTHSNTKGRSLCERPSTGTISTTTRFMPTLWTVFELSSHVAKASKPPCSRNILVHESRWSRPQTTNKIENACKQSAQ